MSDHPNDTGHASSVFPSTGRFPQGPSIACPATVHPRSRPSRHIHTASSNSSAAYLPYIQHRGKFMTAGDVYGQHQRILFPPRNNYPKWGSSYPGLHGQVSYSSAMVSYSQFQNFPSERSNPGLSSKPTESTFSTSADASLIPGPNVSLQRQRQVQHANPSDEYYSNQHQTLNPIPDQTSIARHTIQGHTSHTIPGHTSHTNPGHTSHTNPGHTIPSHDPVPNQNPTPSQNPIPSQNPTPSQNPITSQHPNPPSDPNQENTLDSNPPNHCQNESQAPNSLHANPYHQSAKPIASAVPSVTLTSRVSSQPAQALQEKGISPEPVHNHTQSLEKDSAKPLFHNSDQGMRILAPAPKSASPHFSSFQNKADQLHVDAGPGDGPASGPGRMLDARELPLYFQDHYNCPDALSLVEKLADSGKRDGAVKVQMNPHFQDAYHAYTAQLNPDTFLFKANRLVNNPRHNEIHDRLAFYKVLLKFHADRKESDDEERSDGKSDARTAHETSLSRKKVESDDSVDERSSSSGGTGEKSNASGGTGEKSNASGGTGERISNAPKPKSPLKKEPGQESLQKESPEDGGPDSQEGTSTDRTGLEQSSISANSVVPQPLFTGGSQQAKDSGQSETKSQNEPSQDELDHLKHSQEGHPTQAKTAQHDAASKQDGHIPLAQNNSEARKPPIHASPDAYTKEETPNISEAEGKDGERRKKPLPVMLAKFPMMDKRPLDLFDLFRLVIRKGGFSEVISKKLWAQVGRELGYKGKITSSLSSSLKICYSRLLYPLELHLGDKALPLVYPSLNTQGHPTSESVEQKVLQDHGSEIHKSEAEALAPTPNGSATHKRSTDGDDERGGAKKRKPSTAPLILGSCLEFQRSVRLKSAKGFLLNDPHLMDLKTPLVISQKPSQPAVGPGPENPQSNSEKPKTTKSEMAKSEMAKSETTKSETTKSETTKSETTKSETTKSETTKSETTKSADKERLVTPTGAQAQVKNYLKWLATYSQVFQDSSRLDSNSKMATSCSMRQYIEKDSEFQDYLIAKYPYFFDNRFENPERRVSGISVSTIDEKHLERLFWQYLQDEQDYGRLENGTNIVHFDGILGLDQTFESHKNHLYESAKNNHSSSSTCPQRHFRDSLNTFSLKNVPFLPNSVFSAFSAPDVDNASIMTPHLNVQMTFSTQNWRCEEHFSQACSYLFFGKPKRWYFIPEADFPKFEQLLAETISRSSGKVNKNYNVADWNIAELMDLISNDDESVNTQLECILNSLELAVNIYPERRLKHENTNFQTLIESQPVSPLMNQELLITPEMLAEKGINYTTTLQKPGEMVFRYPKTYACSISLGFNISEELNFASRLWLDYGLEGEKWLSKQGILPNFSFFRLLVNFAQLHESEEHISYFSSAIYSDVRRIFNRLIDQELEVRAKLRKNIKLREVLVEDKPDTDFVTDDSLANCFPSKVVIFNESDKFTCSLETLATCFDKNEKGLEPLDSHSEGNESGKVFRGTTVKSEDSSDPEQENTEASGDSGFDVLALLRKPGSSAELHLSCSDEKLRSWQRSLNAYSTDFEAWLTEYNAMLNRQEDLSLKNYRAVLAEGQKIFAALSGAKDVFGQADNFSPAKHRRYQEFQDQLHTLQKFVDESSDLVDQCQNILSLKHQQRIRGGNEISSDHDDQQLDNLVMLANKIPRLNFFAPEFEQVVEYKNEILNFDRACRQVLQNAPKSIRELDNMISLGESFGIKLPSLMFLKRLRDTMLWTSTYETIFAGGDPFSGRKEIFSLADLKSFYDQGMQILPQSAANRAQDIAKLIRFGNSYDEDALTFLKTNTDLSNLNTTKLEAMIEDMEERSKLKGASRLLVNLDTYQKLVDLKSHEKLIVFIQTFTEKRYSFSDARAYLAEIHETEFLKDYDFPKEDIEAHLKESEKWLASVETHLSTGEMGKDPVPKTAFSAHLHNALKALQNKVLTCLSGEESDKFEKSSPYIHFQALAGHAVPENAEVVRYCHCRGFEDGTMIECDRCHEWYHVNCIDKSQIGPESESYFCPVCLFIKGHHVPPRLPEAKLHEWIKTGNDLMFTPRDELSIMHTIEEAIDKAKSLSHTPNSRPMALLFKMFVLRKFFGCPVLSPEMVVAGDDLKTDLFSLASSGPETESAQDTLEPAVELPAPKEESAEAEKGLESLPSESKSDSTSVSLDKPAIDHPQACSKPTVSESSEKLNSKGTMSDELPEKNMEDTQIETVDGVGESVGSSAHKFQESSTPQPSSQSRESIRAETSSIRAETM